MIPEFIVDVIGFSGGIMLSLQLWPQIYHSYKSGKSNDISDFYLSLNIIGLMCMTIFGVFKNEMPLYIPTSISMLNSIILLVIVSNHRVKTDRVEMYTDVLED